MQGWPSWQLQSKCSKVSKHTILRIQGANKFGIVDKIQNYYSQNFLFNYLGRLSHSELNAFYDEIALMKKVSAGNNPHVVKLIGCVTNQSPMAILLEYAAHGDLLHYLRAMRKVHCPLHQSIYVHNQHICMTFIALHWCCRPWMNVYAP